MEPITEVADLTPDKGTGAALDYPEDVEERVRQYRSDLAFIDANYAALRESYPDRWIGVFRGKVVADADNLSGLLLQVVCLGLPAMGIPMKPMLEQRWYVGGPVSDHYVRSHVDPEYAAELLNQSLKNNKFINANYKELLEQYPDQWIAVYREKVVASDRDMKEMFKQLDFQGIPRGRANSLFLNANPKGRLFNPFRRII